MLQRIYGGKGIPRSMGTSPTHPLTKFNEIRLCLLPPIPNFMHKHIVSPKSLYINPKQTYGVFMERVTDILRMHGFPHAGREFRVWHLVSPYHRFREWVGKSLKEIGRSRRVTPKDLGLLPRSFEGMKVRNIGGVFQSQSAFVVESIGIDQEWLFHAPHTAIYTLCHSCGRVALNSSLCCCGMHNYCNELCRMKSSHLCSSERSINIALGNINLIPLPSPDPHVLPFSISTQYSTILYLLSSIPELLSLLNAYAHKQELAHNVPEKWETFSSLVAILDYIKSGSENNLELEFNSLCSAFNIWEASKKIKYDPIQFLKYILELFKEIGASGGGYKCGNKLGELWGQSMVYRYICEGCGREQGGKEEEVEVLDLPVNPTYKTTYHFLYVPTDQNMPTLQHTFYGFPSDKGEHLFTSINHILFPRMTLGVCENNIENNNPLFKSECRHEREACEREIVIGVVHENELMGILHLGECRERLMTEIIGKGDILFVYELKNEAYMYLGYEECQKNLKAEIDLVSQCPFPMGDNRKSRIKRVDDGGHVQKMEDGDITTDPDGGSDNIFNISDEEGEGEGEGDIYNNYKDYKDYKDYEERMEDTGAHPPIHHNHIPQEDIVWGIFNFYLFSSDADYPQEPFTFPRIQKIDLSKPLERIYISIFEYLKPLIYTKPVGNIVLKEHGEYARYIYSELHPEETDSTSYFALKLLGVESSSSSLSSSSTLLTKEHWEDSLLSLFPREQLLKNGEGGRGRVEFKLLIRANKSMPRIRLHKFLNRYDVAPNIEEEETAESTQSTTECTLSKIPLQECFNDLIKTGKAKARVQRRMEADKKDKKDKRSRVEDIVDMVPLTMCACGAHPPTSHIKVEIRNLGQYLFLHLDRLPSRNNYPVDYPIHKLSLPLYKLTNDLTANYALHGVVAMDRCIDLSLGDDIPGFVVSAWMGGQWIQFPHPSTHGEMLTVNEAAISINLAYILLYKKIKGA